MSPTVRHHGLLGVAILVAGILPPLAYHFVFGVVPTVTVAQAISMVGAPAPQATLVDVRRPTEYAANHLAPAKNWPVEEIAKAAVGGEGRDLIDAPQDSPLLLLGESGLDGARATKLLRGVGRDNVYNVRGGMAGWVASCPEKPSDDDRFLLRNARGETSPLPFRQSSRAETWAGLVVFWLAKPVYLLLTVVLLVVLRRSRAPDLVALRWGFFFFLAGELACEVNFLVFRDDSFLTEYLHSFGMVLSFAFATFAILEGIDRRLIHYSAPAERCAALGLCRVCPKYSDAPCGLRRVFLFLTLACIALCFIPLVARPISVSYNTRVLWVFQNYSNPVLYQLFETRCCPLFAMVLFAAAFGILLFRKADPVSPAKVLFCAGTGYLGFGLFRLFLFTPYRDNLIWFTFWEEATELLSICGVAFILWIFRASLLATARMSDSTNGETSVPVSPLAVGGRL